MSEKTNPENLIDNYNFKTKMPRPPVSQAAFIMFQSVKLTLFPSYGQDFCGFTFKELLDYIENLLNERCKNQ